MGDRRRGKPRIMTFLNCDIMQPYEAFIAPFDSADIAGWLKFWMGKLVSGRPQFDPLNPPGGDSEYRLWEIAFEQTKLNEVRRGLKAIHHAPWAADVNPFRGIEFLEQPRQPQGEGIEEHYGTFPTTRTFHVSEPYCQ